MSHQLEIAEAEKPSAKNCEPLVERPLRPETVPWFYRGAPRRTNPVAENAAETETSAEIPQGALATRARPKPEQQDAAAGQGGVPHPMGGDAATPSPGRRLSCTGSCRVPAPGGSESKAGKGSLLL